MLVNGVLQSNERISFKGSQKSKDSKGHETYEFFLPHDKTRYDVKLEIAPVVRENSSWFVDGKAKTKEFDIKPDEKYEFDPSSMFLPEQDFAYRFKVIDKKTGAASYHQDNGIRIGHYKPEGEERTDKKFVIMHRDRAPGRMCGVMGHALIDNFNPGCIVKDGKIVYDEEKRKKLLEIQRNHSNLYCGDLLGIEAKINYLAEMGIDRQLFTPFGDHRSSHGYWTNTCYQDTLRVGTPEDRKRVVVKAAQKGINLVNDVAFVNEGLEGVHFRYSLKWGKDAYSHNWVKNWGYKTVNILPNVDPKSEEGKELFSHLKIKVTNGDFNYSYDKEGNLVRTANKNKNKKEYTYFQVYDDRLVSDEALKKDEILKRSDILETPNHYDITNHNHSVIIYSFRVHQDELKDFYAALEKHKDKVKNGADNADFLKSALRFAHHQEGIKTPGGSNTWDGKVDVNKLNNTYTNKDEEDLTLKNATPAEKEAYKQATYQVRDYVHKGIIYRAKIDKDAIWEGFANVLKGTADNKDAYKDLIFGTSDKPPCDNLGKASKVITDEIIENVVNNKYYIPELHKTASSQQLLLEGIMNYPLEAIHFSDDLTAVLGSPYLSKRACHVDDIVKTRNEFFKENNYDRLPQKYKEVYYEMDHDFYHGTLSTMAQKILEKADKEGNLDLLKDGNLTDKGKMVVPLISDDIAKFLMVKALAPDVSIKNNNGQLEYDYEALQKVNLLSINGGKGISASSEREEAKKVLDLLKQGVDEIPDNDKNILIENIKDRFKDVSTNALKMAYVVMDKTESGANFRTDATKDTLEIDNVRNGLDSLAKEWEEKQIPIWELLFKGVRSVNPNSYTVAEMTDLHEDDLFGKGSELFSDDLDTKMKFVQKTGATTITDYDVLYGSVQRAFFRDFQDGGDGEMGETYDKQINKIVQALTGENAWGGKNKGFLNNLPGDGVKHSHKFVGNHDKPRLMHNLVLDLAVFYNHADAKDTIQKLTEIYAPKFKAETGTAPDTKALAMAKAVGESLIPMSEAFDDIEVAGVKDKQKVKEALFKATQDLVKGEYKGKKFDAENFATEALDVAIKDVIRQAKFAHGLEIKDEKTFDTLADKALELMTGEQVAKAHAMDEILMGMPGDPTFYMGDQLMESGYETACNNIYVKNRNILHWEWINGKQESKSFIKEFHDKKKDIWNTRRVEGLEALGNGDTNFLTPFTTIVDKEKNESKIVEDGRTLAMFRYNDESSTIVLAHNKNMERLGPEKVIIKNPLDILLKTEKYQKTENGQIKEKEKLSITDSKGDPIHGTDFFLDTAKTFQIDKIDLTPHYGNKDAKDVLTRGLVGGLPVGTMFQDAKEAADIVYGVCVEKVQDAEKFVIKQFNAKTVDGKNVKAETVYQDCVKAYEEACKNKTSIEHVFKDAKAIDLKKNVMFLKKVNFRGRRDSNYIKIQAYLNSKTYLNEKPRYATVKA